MIFRENSFKDNHICDGCGKPLSKCTCKVDDDEIEEDFDYSDFSDGSIESGDEFDEGGVTYYWGSPESDKVYDDFDVWQVWSADSEDGDTVYFVVEVDTGFIDWGPCDIATEAIEFLNGKKVDDDALEESIFGHPSDESEIDSYDSNKDYIDAINKEKSSRRNKRLARNYTEVELDYDDSKFDDDLDEDLNLTSPSQDGEYLIIKINGTPYKYTLKSESPYSVEDMVHKVGKMMKFSYGKALQFLKKNMVGTRIQSEASRYTKKVTPRVKYDLTDDPKTDLTKKKGSISNIFLDNQKDLSSATSKEDLISKVKKLFDDNELNTQKTREILFKLGQCRNFNTALQYVWNIILKGGQQGVHESLDESVLTEDRALSSGTEIDCKDGSKITVEGVTVYMSDFDGSPYVKIQYSYERPDGSSGTSECDTVDLFHMINGLDESLATQSSSIGQHKRDSFDMIPDEYKDSDELSEDVVEDEIEVEE